MIWWLPKELDARRKLWQGPEEECWNNETVPVHHFQVFLWMLGFEVPSMNRTYFVSTPPSFTRTDVTTASSRSKSRRTRCLEDHFHFRTYWYPLIRDCIVCTMTIELIMPIAVGGVHLFAFVLEDILLLSNARYIARPTRSTLNETH